MLPRKKHTIKQNSGNSPIETLRLRVTELEEEKAIKQQELDEIQDDIDWHLEAIERLAGELYDKHNGMRVVQGVYPIKAVLQTKYLYTLRMHKRFMHNREVAEFMIKNEPGLSIQDVLDRLGKFVGKWKKRRVIVVFEALNSRRNAFYGLPEWMDANGQIRKGYEYNEDALIDKKKENTAQMAAL
jgi:hypothetical protein